MRSEIRLNFSLFILLLFWSLFGRCREKGSQRAALQGTGRGDLLKSHRYFCGFSGLRVPSRSSAVGTVGSQAKGGQRGRPAPKPPCESGRDEAAPRSLQGDFGGRHSAPRVPRAELPPVLTRSERSGSRTQLCGRGNALNFRLKKKKKSMETYPSASSSGGDSLNVQQNIREKRSVQPGAAHGRAGCTQ